MRLNKLQKFQVALTSAGIAAATALPAHAALDVTEITDKVTEVATAGAVVGAAIIVMCVAIKAFKWLKSAM